MRTDGTEPDPALSLPTKLTVAGAPVSPVGLARTLELAEGAVRSGVTLDIAVTNANKCWLARRHPELRDFMERAGLVVSETSTVWGARRLGLSGVDHVWGVDLMARLMDRASEEGWSVYLLGAREEVLQALLQRARQRWPGASIVGARNGYFEWNQAPSIAEEIVRADPDLLLVAMGSPRQERFMALLPPERGPRLRLGVGGSFDVHSGAVKDAPAWIRGSGFEWLYRALRSPRLFRRYAVVNPWFVLRVLRDARRGRGRP